MREVAHTANHATTRMGAEAIGVEDTLGTIEPGKFADVLLLDRSPLDDLSALEAVQTVIKEGERIPLYPEWHMCDVRLGLQT